MAKIIKPVVNPIKFVPFEHESSADSMKLDDRYNFDFLPASFEARSTYSQKWKKGVPIRQQIWSQNMAIVRMQVVDCSGEILSTINPSAGSLIGYIVNDLSFNINQFDYDTSVLANGKEFYIILKYGQTEETLITEISERQVIVEGMDELLIFKYSHTFNEYNCVFKTSYNSFFNQTFYFCVEGRAADKNDEGNFVEFDDQKINRTLLSAKPFPTWQMIVGGAQGVPEFIGTHLNMIRSCNTVEVLNNYKIAFFEKWDKKDAKFYRKYLYSIRFSKSKNEYASEYEICEPVTAAALAMPDGYEGIPYYYSQKLNGTKPYTIDVAGSTKPAWMMVTIIDDMLFLQSIAVDDITAAEDIEIEIKIDNPCGTVTLEDTITIFPAASCTAVGFTGTNIIGSPVFGQPWAAFIGLSGSTPYTLSNVVKPAWATVTALTTGIEITGTPNIGGPFVLSFDIENCAGSGAKITFNQDFTVASNITITGNNDKFRNSNPAQSGLILAAPGTLVTVTLMVNAIGASTLTITLAGATPSVPLVATTGSTINGTFIMPGTGFVTWSGAFSSDNIAGSGTVSVS